jgi:isocitrate/isopropylmalate dehydrogenase
LRWLGERKADAALRRAGDAIEQAVAELLARGTPLTYDLVGEKEAAKSSAVGAAITARVLELLG